MSTQEQRLGVLVATIDEKVERTVRGILPQLTKSHVLVSHQITEESDFKDLEGLGAQHVEYSQIKSRGLAKNRNNSLAHMTQEINLLADDDVEYIPDFESVVLKEYESHKDADVITFRVERDRNASGERGDHFEHNRWTLRKVPSIGISFRKSSIEKANIKFDERFGIGSTYASGEEAVFLKDCLDAGLKLIHVDAPIVRHTHLSSGWIWDKKQVEAKVAVMWRLYGPVFGLLIPLGFTFTKYSLYKEHMNIFEYVGTVLKSFFGIAKRGL